MAQRLKLKFFKEAEGLVKRTHPMIIRMDVIRTPNHPTLIFHRADGKEPIRFKMTQNPGIRTLNQMKTEVGRRLRKAS